MDFSSFPLHPKVQAGIAACGYSSPTPIQAQSIGPILAGQDILGLAQTGTGKTAAFALPLIHRLLDGPRNRVRALIVAPTRELAEQIHVNVRLMAKETGLRSAVLYGGVGKQPQIKALRAGAEIVVACPGRLLDLVAQGDCSLTRVEVVVLDEADHMFDKGFLPDIRRIIKQLPKKRQSLVFSATMPSEIRALTRDILVDPITVQIDADRPAKTISHLVYEVANERKTGLLKSILKDPAVESALVFTRTKYKAKNLGRQLEKAGFKATSLQGNLSQQKRQQAMDGFRNGTYTILVATDIAARGIDVEGVSDVINFDIPDTVEAYTHRTGRTGRAERSGRAMTFANADDSKMLRSIERTLGYRLERAELPETVAQAEEAPPRPIGEGNRNPRPRSRRPNKPGRGRASSRSGSAS